MSTATWTEADEAVLTSVARQLRSKYYGYVDLEDIRAELYLKLVMLQRNIEEWREDHSPQTADRILARSLRNHGEKYCRREKAEYCGYSVDDEFFYSITMIADIIQLYFDPEYMMPGSIPLGQTSSGKPASEGGNLMAMVADVGRAYEQMPERDRYLLREVYGGDMPVRESIAFLALEWGCTHGAADKRIRRVLGRLRKNLGGPRPWEDSE